MTVNTTAGSTIAICAAAPATFNEAGYEALTWALIGEVTDLGEFGREYALVTHNPIAKRSTVKKKGSFNEGALTLGLGLDDDDAGQEIASDAVDSDDDAYLRIILQDGTTFYMGSQVMSFKIAAGSVDQITNATINFEITTNDAGVGIVKVAAA